MRIMGVLRRRHRNCRVPVGKSGGVVRVHWRFDGWDVLLNGRDSDSMWNRRGEGLVNFIAHIV
jgi:hypothetical protein